MCIEFLPEGRDGGLVLGKVHFKVCQQVGMLLSEVVDGSRWIARVHMVSRARIRRSLADAGERANAAVVLLWCWWGWRKERGSSNSESWRVGFLGLGELKVGGEGRT